MTLAAETKLGPDEIQSDLARARMERCIASGIRG